MTDINICGMLRDMDSMDAGQFVECKFVIPRCGQVAGGGDLTLRLDAESAKLLMRGDHVSIHLRPAP